VRPAATQEQCSPDRPSTLVCALYTFQTIGGVLDRVTPATVAAEVLAEPTHGHSVSDAAPLHALAAAACSYITSLDAAGTSGSPPGCWAQVS